MPKWQKYKEEQVENVKKKMLIILTGMYSSSLPSGKAPNNLGPRHFSERIANITEFLTTKPALVFAISPYTRSNTLRGSSGLNTGISFGREQI